MELLADIAGPDSLPVAQLDASAPNGSAEVSAPEWAQLAAPTEALARDTSSIATTCSR